MVTHRPSVNDVVYRQLCRISSIRSVAVTTISLIVDFLLVVDVTAGSTEQCADRRALPAADQRALSTRHLMLQCLRRPPCVRPLCPSCLGGRNSRYSNHDGSDRV